MNFSRLLLLLVLFSTSIFGQNSLIVNDISEGPGATSAITIALENQNEITGFQFTLKVPDNLVLNEKEVSFVGRNTDHVIYPKDNGNGEYLFICFSGTNDNFTDDLGDLIQIPIEIPVSYVPGETYDMELESVILSSSTGEDVGSNHQNGLLTVIEGTHPDLIVENISFSELELIPGESTRITWDVNNIGEAIALGGWREQIYLSSQNGENEYLVLTDSFTGDLDIDGTVNRNTEFNIPSIIGFDGEVIIKIVLVPYATVKETDDLVLNNTSLSTDVATLQKKILFSIDKTEITKNSADEIRVDIKRSGDISVAETFTITSNANEFFNLPITITLSENQSSAIEYFSLATSTGYTGDQEVVLTASGSDYDEETATLTLIEDQKINLSINYPSDYTSAIGDVIVFTLEASGSNTVDKAISINSNNSSRISLPSEIILPAEETSITFEGTILDTGAIEKKEVVQIYAEATDYISGSNEFEISAINIPNFELELAPVTASEGDGIEATYATIKRSTHTDQEVAIEISSDYEDRLILPSTFVFAEGELEKKFNIGTVDNSIVEGDQLINVYAKIIFDDCNCTDDTDDATIASSQFTVIDNDGLALTLSASPSTIKAGTTNNSLIISRNTTDATILENAVEVTLTNSLPSVLTTPESVTIPAGESEVEVSFDTQIDASLSGDQSIRIEANAEGHSAGFSWVLITDQNLPDVIISEVQLLDEVEAGTVVEVSTTVVNQGFADFGTNAKLEYYISENNSIVGLEPFNTSILSQGIISGETYDYTEEVQLPTISGNLNLIVLANSDNGINELSHTNNQNYKEVNFLPAYAVTVTLDKSVYLPNEKVIITGEAKTNQTNESVGLSDVEITINNGEFERVFTTTTNDNGAFVYEFEPVENEAGNYSVKASYPGADVNAQATFDILGFEIVDKEQYIKWEPFVDFPLEKQFVLKNNTSVNLTGVTISLAEDAVFEIEQTPIDIAAGQEVAFNFNIITDEASIEQVYAEIPITITSVEGAALKETVYYYSKTKTANLLATPISIETTMVKDMTRSYQFTIKNIGDVDAIDVQVDIPVVDWMRLKSPELISSIKAGEEAQVFLEFEPTIKEQLNVPISGNLSFKASNSNALSVPFRIETVSQETGSITVDATDEYTYNTAEAPHLAGALVQIKHPFTGEIVVEGVTDENGLFEVPIINEGYYTVNVSAEKHEEYQATILVDPGRTTFVNAFMQYQAITYTWDVVRTEIEDEYEITLITEFETNVPKPVIVMEIDNTSLDLEEGETRQINLTVTNHGLIEAYDVKFGFSQSGDYDVKLLIESMDTLPAKTTVVVPVILSRPISAVAARSANSTGGCPWLDFIVDALFFCQGDIAIGESASMDRYGDCYGGGGVDYIYGPGLPGGGGCSICGSGSGSSAANITLPDLCNPCLTGVIGAGLGCAPVVPDEVSCSFSLLTSSDPGSGFLAGIGCALSALPKPFDMLGCAWGIGTAIGTCIYEGISSRSASSVNTLSSTSNTSSVLEAVEQDFGKISDARDASQNIVLEYFGDGTIVDKEGYEFFVAEIGTYIDDEVSITDLDIIVIKQNLSNTDIEETFLDSFFTRWNATIEAWNQGVLSPNEMYPNIIDKVKLEEYHAVRAELAVYMTERGFISVDEMYESGYDSFQEYIEELSEDESSVCATITIEFPQTLTMTREAFEGTLTIDNASDKNLTDVFLDLVVANEIGENKTELFQINKEAFLEGSGMVAAGESGSGVALFIPTKEAAPEVAQSYSFGGVLSYYDEEVGERVYITLNPVTLEVNPSPDLILDYFLQRDIFGDDPLTEATVEPSIPAELSLMITNDGYGDARNVKVESMQPEIVDNEKGLLIDFEMIGSNFNNEPKELGLLEVDYGDIAAKTSSVGQWYFTSSLIGHFVSYDINVNHVSDYSNENLSLIKGAYIHELIKSVRAYQDGNDEIADFLVNDEADANDTPDRIYFSNGTSDEVFEADLVESSNDISAANLTTTVTINPFTTGWNYGYIEDPGGSLYKLLSVVRDTDSQEIPLDNFWQTTVTLRDGLNPKYENNLHVLDNITEITSYTLTYAPLDDNMPSVTSITGVPESESSAVPLEVFTVTFNKEIDVNTFTSDNIDLVSQGEHLSTEDILIGKIDETTYSLNLQGLTNLSGYYELTVSSVGIKDTLGNEGANAERVNWIQFLNELGILQFQSDQIKNAPLNSVAVVFNKEIRSEEFTIDKLTINDTAVDSNVTITQIDAYNYSISGIDTFNQEDGDYELSIDLTSITAADGTLGLAAQSFSWVVDNSLPEIVNIETVVQAGIHNQNITEIDIELNKVLSSEIDASAISIYKDGLEIDVPVTILQIDDLNYKILGLGAYTSENGGYSISIDQTTFVDEAENTGVGVYEESWTVNVNTLVGIANLSITPDNGILDNDNITSGNDVALVYDTLEDNLTVQVYELVATSEVLINETFRETAGEYSVPLDGQLGAKRFKVVAIDQDGNISDAQIISAYIDFSDIDVAIEAVKESDENDCYDFDYVNITFSEAIAETSFTNEAIQLTSSGIVIPSDEVVITKIDDANYRLDNLLYEGNGLITITIDKTKIVKQSSGFIGLGIAEQELGVNNTDKDITITGEENPVTGVSYTYTATENLLKYDWIIVNGEIVSSNANSVEILWNVEGEHVLMLRSQTVLGCVSTSQITVSVQEGTSLEVNGLENEETNLSIGPNPNKGQFSIHTNQQLNNCKIDVFNVIGELVYSESDVSFGRDVANIEIPNIASGMYILIITQENKKFEFRMIIQ